MITILAPSKTMDFTPINLPAGAVTTIPQFQPQAEHIMDTLRQIDDLAPLLHASQAIADKTVLAYKNWGNVTKPSIYAYVGDVYKGFYANTLSSDDLAWTQQHIMTMSGLYGALRPLDVISAYRLEMKAPLAVDGDKNLYEFWGSELAQFVDSRADGVICVLSSDEYAKPVTAYTASRIVTPVFLDNKPNGTIGTVPIYSKMMRGVMARWIIDNRIDDPQQLSRFTVHGYAYSATHSTPSRPAFLRQHMTPLQL